jgi:hypothetical protein
MLKDRLVLVWLLRETNASAGCSSPDFILLGNCCGGDSTYVACGDKAACVYALLASARGQVLFLLLAQATAGCPYLILAFIL